MAYNITAFMDKLTCTNYIDFGKIEDRFGQFSWSQNDSNYLDVKLKVLKEAVNKDSRLVQNRSTVDSDFNQFVQLRNQLLIAAKSIGGKQNLSPIQITTMSKDMDEQVKLFHRVVDVVDGPSTKICATMLQYNVDKPKSPDT